MGSPPLGKLIDLGQVRSFAAAEGLVLGSALSRVDAEAALKIARPALESWQTAGHAGEMRYMNRPGEMFSTLDTVMPAGRSVLVFLVPYSVGVQAGALPAGSGRVARYAWGRDYHRALRKRLRAFVRRTENLLGEKITAREFSDSVPLLERALGHGADLGFLGKNTLLIRPGVGSFTFLCEVIWDVEVSGVETPLLSPPGSGCGTCQRCVTACPTSAIQPGRIDARRCISYLTIEKKTAFSEWEAQAIGEWVFGCDICQEVCPFNHGAHEQLVLQEFLPESGSGRALNLEMLFKIKDDAAFTARFAGTAIMRAGRAPLLRNACAVAANRLRVELLPELERLAAGDSSQLVRAEAARSIERIGWSGVSARQRAFGSPSTAITP